MIFLPQISFKNLSVVSQSWTCHNPYHVVSTLRQQQKKVNVRVYVILIFQILKMLSKILKEFYVPTFV